MASSKDAIGILFGVLGGGDVNGESYKEINKDLDILIDNINKHDPKFVKLNLDSEDFEKNLSGIQEKLNGILKGIDLSQIGSAIASALKAPATGVASVEKAIDKVVKAEKREKKAIEDVRTAREKAYDESKTDMLHYLEAIKTASQKGKRHGKRGFYIDESGNYGTDFEDMKQYLSVLADAKDRYDKVFSSERMKEMGLKHSSEILKLDEEIRKEKSGLTIFKTNTSSKTRSEQSINAAKEALAALHAYRDELERVFELVTHGNKSDGAYFNVDKFLPASESEAAIQNAHSLNAALQNVKAALGNKHLTKIGGSTAVDQFADKTKYLRQLLTDIFYGVKQPEEIIDSIDSKTISLQKSIDGVVESLRKILSIKRNIDDIAAIGGGTAIMSPHSTPVLGITNDQTLSEYHLDELDEAISVSNALMNNLRTIIATSPEDSYAEQDVFKEINELLQIITKPFDAKEQETKEIVDTVTSAWTQEYRSLKDKSDISPWINDIKQAASDIKREYGKEWSDAFIAEISKRTRVDKAAFGDVSESKKQYVAATSELVEQKEEAKQVHTEDEAIAQTVSEITSETKKATAGTEQLASEIKNAVQDAKELASAAKEVADEAERAASASAAPKKKSSKRSSSKPTSGDGGGPASPEDSSFRLPEHSDTWKLEHQIAEARRSHEKEKAEERKRIAAEEREQKKAAAAEVAEAERQVAEEQKKEDKAHKDSYKDRLASLKEYYAKETSMRKESARNSDLVTLVDGSWEPQPGGPFEQRIKEVDALKKKFDELGFSQEVLSRPESLADNKRIENAQKLNLTIDDYNKLLSQAIELNNGLRVSDEEAASRTATAWRKNRKTIEEFLASKNDALKRDPRARAVADELQKIIQVDDPKNLTSALDKYKELLDIVAKNGTDIPSFFSKLEKSLKTAIVTFTTAAIGKYLRDVYNQVVRIDSAMTKLKIVTNENELAIKNYGKEAAASAKKIGVSISNLINSTTDYAKLGFSLEDASKLAEITASFARVSDTSTDDATRNITGIVKAYDVQTNALERVADKLVYVGNNYAISQAEIGEGMNNAASSLQANGNSLNQAIGLLTAANTTVQDIDRASTALRTITARLSASKAQLDALGEDSTGVETVAKLEEQFSAFGINITDGNHQLMSTYDIVKQISDRWETLNTEQRNTIAGLAAGTRQQDIFFSLINNFADAEEIVSKVEDSTGSLASATEKRLDSVQGRLDQLSATLEELATNLLDSDWVKGGISLISGLVKAIDRLAASGDGLLIKMIGLAVAVSSLSNGIKALGGTRIALLIKDIKLFSAAEWKAMISTEGLDTALKTLGLNPWMIAITVAIELIMLLVNHIKKVTVSLEEQKQALEDAKSAYKDSCDEIDRLNDELKTTQDRINELNNLEKLSFSEKEEYDNLVKQNNELQRQLSIEKAINREKFKDKNAEFIKTVDKDLFASNEYIGSSQNGYKKTWSLGGILRMAFPSIFSFADNHSSEEDVIKERLNEYNKYITEYQTASNEKERKKAKKSADEISDYFIDKYDELNEYSSDISYIAEPSSEDERKVNEYLDYIYDFEDMINIALGGDNAKTNAFNRIVDNWKFDEAVQKLQDLGKNGQVTAEMLNDPKYNEFIQKLVDIGVVEKDDLESIALAFNNFDKSISNTASTLKTVTSKSPATILDEIKDGYDGISEALKDMDAYGKLSADSLSSLYKLEAEGKLNGIKLNDILTKTSDGYQLCSDALDKYIQSIVEGYTVTGIFASEQDKLNAIENLTSLKAVLVTMGTVEQTQEEMMNKQLDNFNNLIDVRKKLLETYKSELDYQKELEKKQKNLSILQQKLAVSRLDTSASGMNQTRELAEELASAQEELSDYTLEHAIDEVVNDLDSQYSQYKAFIEEKINSINDSTKTASDAIISKIDEAITVVSGSSYVSSATAQRREDIERRYAREDAYARNSITHKYHSGGIVGGHSFNPATEQYAKLMKGELVSTPSQIENFMKSTLPDIARYGSNSAISYNAPLVSINCDSITSDSIPSVKKIVDEAVIRIKGMIDSGINRTGYKKQFV